jgi:hypothetical protein
MTGGAIDPYAGNLPARARFAINAAVGSNVEEGTVGLDLDRMHHRRWLCLCIVIGTALRLVWLDDMEYKADQVYIFDSCQSSLAGAALPALGMPSGPSLLNPGMSLWWHIGYCNLFTVTTPLALAYLSPVLGVLALLLLWLFIEREVPAADRPAWLWAAALSSVSTLTISLQRIIWSQTILPIFSVLFIWSWWRRERTAPAFFWGLIGAIVGQIHMSGFFFAAAFVLGELWSHSKPVRWKAWLCGSLLGAWPMLTWLSYVANETLKPHPGGSALKHVGEVAKLLFWLYGLSEPWGLEFGYRLGVKSWLRFLGYPIVWGVPSYGIGLCHLLLVAAGLWVYFRSVRPHWGLPVRSRLASLIAAFRSGTMSETHRAIMMALVGMGILLTLTTLRLHRHYLIIAFPLTTVFFCALALRLRAAGRNVLTAMCALQLVVSIGFLYFVHVNRGAPGEEYGIAYSFQPDPAPTPKNAAATTSLSSESPQRTVTPL